MNDASGMEGFQRTGDVGDKGLSLDRGKRTA